MSERIKIKISEQAYYILTDLLEDGSQYSHLRFSYKDGCCGSSKVELLLDNAKAQDILDKIDGLPVLYDSLVLDNIKEITVVYRNNSFMVKTELLNQQRRACSSCTKGCGGNANSSSGCSGCKKDGCN